MLTKWSSPDSILNAQPDEISHEYLLKYSRSLEHVTQIYIDSCGQPDRNILNQWWAWFALYSDYLCWDNYNKKLYVREANHIYNYAPGRHAKMPAPPRSPFVQPKRKSYEPLY